MKSKKVIIFSFLLMIVMIFVCLLFVLKDNRNRAKEVKQNNNSTEIRQDAVQKEISNSVNYGNILQGGLLAQAGDWIYYANREDNYSLYRKNIKDKKVEKLNNAESDYINIYDNHIFYRQYRQPDNLNISRMELDGSADSVIYNGTIGDLICYDGKLYFTAGLGIDGGSTIVAIDPNNSTFRKLYTGRVSYPPMVDGKQVYFHSDGKGQGGGNLGIGIACVDYDTLKSKIICKDERYEDSIISPILDGKNIYYLNTNGNLCCIDLTDGFKKRKICTLKCPDYIVKEGDYIYYGASYGELQSLHRVSLKTKEDEIVLSVEGEIAHFEVVKNAIYITYTMNRRMPNEKMERLLKILE